MTRKKLPLAMALAAFFGASVIANGQGQQSSSQQEQGTWETVPAFVTSKGDTGFFDVFSAYTLPKRWFSVSGFRHNIDRDPQDLDISNFIGTFAVGVSDRVEVFGAFDVQRRIDADDLVVGSTSFFNDEPLVKQGWTSGVGDFWVGAKYNIFSEYQNKPVGLGVRGFLKIPTASDGDGLGTGKVSGGGHIVASKDLGPKVQSSYYAGFRANASPDTVDIGNAFEWGLGLSFPKESKLRGMLELTGSAYSGASQSQTNPVDLLVGFNVALYKGVTFSAGYRRNLNALDLSTDRPEGLNVRLAYHPGVHGAYTAPAPPPPPPSAPQNRPPTVRVTANPSEVEEGANSQVHADARDPDNDPLTYAWRAPDGRVTGSGPDVTWTAPTSVEGSYPVTVTVDDGRGGTASDTTNIRVRRRVVKAIEFEDVHFLFDRYDLTDEARRILDDAVAKLRENPNLRIEIEGHCCSIGTEEYNLSLGARRADAVKTYLSRAGIPESRLTTISYGESRPAHDNSREVTRRLNRRAHLRVLITAPNEEN